MQTLNCTCTVCIVRLRQKQCSSLPAPQFDLKKMPAGERDEFCTGLGILTRLVRLIRIWRRRRARSASIAGDAYMSAIDVTDKIVCIVGSEGQRSFTQVVSNIRQLIDRLRCSLSQDSFLRHSKAKSKSKNPNSPQSPHDMKNHVFLALQKKYAEGGLLGKVAGLLVMLYFLHFAVTHFVNTARDLKHLLRSRRHSGNVPRTACSITSLERPGNFPRAAYGMTSLERTLVGTDAENEASVQRRL